MEVFKTVAEISCDLNTVLNAGADILFGAMFLGTIMATPMLCPSWSHDFPLSHK